MKITEATVAPLLRDFAHVLVNSAGVHDAETELVKKPNGDYEIRTRAELRLYATQQTTLHAQTLLALDFRQNVDVAGWLTEHIVDPHYKNFSERLRQGVLAATIAWDEATR